MQLIGKMMYLVCFLILKCLLIRLDNAAAADDDSAVSSPLPKLRIPSDAIVDSIGDDDEEASVEEEEDEDEVGDLPTVKIGNEYEEDNQLS
jgi:hypothetical protein